MPHDTGSYVEVRAVGAYLRGLRHWVRRPAGKGLDGLPALCGATSRRGWVANPAFGKDSCETCSSRMDVPR